MMIDVRLNGRAGGTKEISRWRKPPVHCQCEFSPERASELTRCYPTPLRGSCRLFNVTGGSRHRLISLAPLAPVVRCFYNAKHVPDWKSEIQQNGKPALRTNL